MPFSLLLGLLNVVITASTNAIDVNCSTAAAKYEAYYCSLPKLDSGCNPRYIRTNESVLRGLVVVFHDYTVLIVISVTNLKSTNDIVILLGYPLSFRRAQIISIQKPIRGSQRDSMLCTCWWWAMSGCTKTVTAQVPSAPTGI